MSTTDVAAGPVVDQEIVVLPDAIDLGDPSPPVLAPAPAEERTTRLVLRHLDLRSVLRLSAVFYACAWVVLLIAGVVLWLGAAAVGVVGNVEHFMRDIGFDGFRFLPLQLFRAAAIAGIVLVAAGTAANVLAAALYNLLGDAVGGLGVTVAEEGGHERRR